MMLAKSLQSAAGNAAGAGAYIEDVFSTYLYTGNGSTQTITNGIDLAGEGGLVWLKNRSVTSSHRLVDTVRGALSTLFSESTSAAVSRTAPNTDVNSFTSTGFVAGNFGSTSGDNWASWTFRKQPKFFDVVTYTGNGSSPRNIAHSLGSAPGCIFLKRTDATDNWFVFHRSIDVTSTSSGNVLCLNLTNELVGPTNVFAYTVPTATTFTVGSNANINGATYVAYLFAHDSGGFGESGEDNVISCGSFENGTFGGTATLPFPECQWALVKCATGAGQWFIVDNMRGLYYNGTDAAGLLANSSNEEQTRNIDMGTVSTSNGQLRIFGGDDSPGNTYIYIAIRRGPMKTPTTGTSVFSPNAQNTGTTPLVTTNFPVDLSIGTDRTGASRYVVDRLRGTTAASSQYLETNSTIAEAASGGGLNFANNTGFTDAFLGYSQSIFWNFRRAPGFMDEVCYTGTGADQYVTHGLGVAPELVIFKARIDPSSQNPGWYVQVPLVTGLKSLVLNTTAAASAGDFFAGLPTSTQLRTRANANYALNYPGYTYVAYLFASCPGVSKVGSYTGTGTTQQINCGFTAGARFVLIKKTSGTGSWYVWDSARGIVSGNDPYLLLNSTAAEVTSTDYVDTYSAGFEISSTAPSEINENGGSFIFFAVA